MKPRGKYFSESYDSKERFISYWHQIHEIVKLNPEKVLEVGVGNGFVSEYLRKRGIDVITLDIDEGLNPDIVGNVISMPLQDNSFDVVACYEVLEHLPYERFHQALREIFRVSKLHAVLSLPDVARVYRYSIHIPKIGYKKILFSLPRLRKQVHKFDGEHYWEIGKAGFPLNKIIRDIKSAGFIIHKTYRVFEHPYHRFFILKKRST